MVKYQEIDFWTDIYNLNRARNMLKKDFNLVEPKNDPLKRTEKDILVWEDKENIGRYRIHFLTYPSPRIYFRYWGRKLTKEIEKRDPMYDAIAKTYELIRPVKKITISSAGVILKSKKFI